MKEVESRPSICLGKALKAMVDCPLHHCYCCPYYPSSSYRSMSCSICYLGSIFKIIYSMHVSQSSWFLLCYIGCDLFVAHKIGLENIISAELAKNIGELLSLEPYCPLALSSWIAISVRD